MARTPRDQPDRPRAVGALARGHFFQVQTDIQQQVGNVVLAFNLKAFDGFLFALELVFNLQVDHDAIKSLDPDLEHVLGVYPVGDVGALEVLLGIDTVNMYLIVMDISLYSDTEPLPIPASMEEEIVEKAFAKFVTVTSETGIVNNYTSAQKNN